jgi:hypothetical protein
MFAKFRLPRKINLGRFKIAAPCALRIGSTYAGLFRSLPLGLLAL